MDVLTKNVPTLDPDDIPGSFGRIYDYLFNTMEQIDYTLSRQGIQLGKVNLAGTASQIQQLNGQVNALTSSLTVVSGSVSALAARVDDNQADHEARLGAMEGAAQALRTDVEALKTNLTALEARVKELEGTESGS